jgi:hypothetical protein
MALTVASLVSRHAVDIGAFRSESHDGLSIYLGHGLYHDPGGGGYTGLLYTPLLPALVAGLDVFGRWGGWPALISVLATAALAIMIGRLAFDAANDNRIAPRLGAIGMAGVAVWIANCAVGLLYLGWSDELAWAFAIGGLLAGARARTFPGAVPAVLLLTLAFWSKQTTLAADVVFALWLLALAWRRERTRGFVAGTLAGLAVANLIVLGGLALLTGGWEFFFNFTLPTRQTRVFGSHQFVHDAIHVLAVPFIWAAAIGVASFGREWRSKLKLDNRATLLAMFAVIGVPFAMYFRSKQGGNPNQYLGVFWTLGALAALAWGTSRRRREGLWVDALILVAVIGAAITTAQRTPRYDLHLLRYNFGNSIPADLRALGRQGGLFNPNYTDLTPGQVYPDTFNAADLLAADEQPMSVVRALAARRFRYAQTYASTLGNELNIVFNPYASAYGKYEASYFWKLDQLIVAGYGPARGLPAGVLERRPGPNRARALLACFGPFRLAGTEWTIRHGGGLWCNSGDNTVTLKASPASASELVSTDSGAASGTLTLTGRSGAVVLIVGASGWAVDARRTGAGWHVSTRRAGRAALVGTQPAPRLALNLGGGHGLNVGPDPGRDRVSIVATPDRGVTVDFTGFKLR